LNSPVEQSKIVKKRPFLHLQVLKDYDLIKVTKNGHKNILETTKKFKFLFKNKK
jgi:chromosome segregation and condensation protein ScpB